MISYWIKMFLRIAAIMAIDTLCTGLNWPIEKAIHSYAMNENSIFLQSIRSF